MTLFSMITVVINAVVLDYQIQRVDMGRKICYANGASSGEKIAGKLLPPNWHERNATGTTLVQAQMNIYPFLDLDICRSSV